MLLRGLSALICIGFGLWLLLHWSGYAQTHARGAEGWHVGGVSMVEITLVESDREGLACASNVEVAGLRCGYQAGGRSWSAPPAPSERLMPYSTVRKQLLLGAGLWTQPALLGKLPSQRFTVVCNFHVEGVMGSAAVRWGPAGAFDPLPEAIAVGRLTECVIPP